MNGIFNINQTLALFIEIIELNESKIYFEDSSKILKKTNNIKIVDLKPGTLENKFSAVSDCNKISSILNFLKAVYTQYEPFLAQDKTILKHLNKVSSLKNQPQKIKQKQTVVLL